MKKTLLELLYRSFDTQLSAQENDKLEEALAKSEELRRERERIRNLRAEISQHGKASFKGGAILAIAGRSFSPNRCCDSDRSALHYVIQYLQKRKFIN